MNRHLVLVGGGHAHLTTISAIRSLVKRGHIVTLIAPSDHHYYSGMAPGLLAGTYRPQEVRFNVRKLATGRGGRFIRGKVVSINPHEKAVFLEDGQRVLYDVISFNVGSATPSGIPVAGSTRVFTVKPIDRILEGRNAVRDSGKSGGSGNSLELVVIGGGPAGVEVSGALWRLTREERIEGRVTLLTGSGLLDSHPERFRDKARRSLLKRGIIIKEGARVASIGSSRVSLEDGSEIGAHIVFIATGVRPSRLFSESGLPTGEDGGLLVNDYLQCVKYPEIFGGGDCISVQDWNLARAGVYAVRQNPVLLHNLSAALEDKPLQSFNPGNPNFLLILNLGDSTALLKKGNFIWKGAIAFKLKDFIDRRFMRKFQLSGELEEAL